MYGDVNDLNKKLPKKPSRCCTFIGVEIVVVSVLMTVYTIYLFNDVIIQAKVLLMMFINVVMNNVSVFPHYL